MWPFELCVTIELRETPFGREVAELIFITTKSIATVSLSFEIKASELQMIKYIHTPSETRIFLAFCQYRLGCEIFDILH